MQRTVKTKLPIGQIASIKLLEDGSYEIIQNLPDNFLETVTRGSPLLKLIKASELSENDLFMQYTPKTSTERTLKGALEFAIRHGLKDFYVPCCAPSFTEDGEGIVYEFGKLPAVNKSYVWWAMTAKRINPYMNSRLGKKREYVAYLGFIIKTLVENKWSVEEAWDAVCNDSKKLGHYANSENAKGQLEPTGSRMIAGFYDLANTYKILAVDDDEPKEQTCFWLAGGAFNAKSTRNPLAYIAYYYYPNYNYEYGTGWVVFEY